MTAEPDAGTDQIELHFCHRCGISIPQPEIDGGRARPVPGGFVCATCARRPAEAVAAGTRRPPAGAPRETGTRVLTILALLYVVGATTFLLAREIQRPAPVAPRKDLATTGDLETLARKLEEVEQQTREAFEDLKGNDVRGREDLAALSGTVNRHAENATRTHDRLRAQVEDLEGVVHALGQKTGLVKEEVEAAVREIRQLRERVAEGVRAEPVPPAPAEPEGRGEVRAAQTPEELERERQVKQFLDKLADKNASNQTRYNAAVQLGDLKHAGAVPGLVEALQNDSYDLVRRACAWSLGMFGKDAVPAIPSLIDQIGGKEEYVGYMCERALGEITKAVLGKPVTFNFDPTMSQRQRKKVQKDWEDWWQKNREQILPQGS